MAVGSSVASGFDMLINRHFAKNGKSCIEGGEIMSKRSNATMCVTCINSAGDIEAEDCVVIRLGLP